MTSVSLRATSRGAAAASDAGLNTEASITALAISLGTAERQVNLCPFTNRGLVIVDRVLPRVSHPRPRAELSAETSRRTGTRSPPIAICPARHGQPPLTALSSTPQPSHPPGALAHQRHAPRWRRLVREPAAWTASAA